MPTSAVVFDADGTRVGVVESDKVHFKKVTLGRDYGTEVEIASGLAGDESVITNPGLRTTEGSDVRANTPVATNTQQKPEDATVQATKAYVRRISDMLDDLRKKLLGGDPGRAAGRA